MVLINRTCSNRFTIPPPGVLVSGFEEQNQTFFNSQPFPCFREGSVSYSLESFVNERARLLRGSKPNEINIALEYASLCSSKARLRQFKQRLKDLSHSSGLSYEQARQLSVILESNKDFKLGGVHGFWNNTNTSRNMTFSAFDSINEFQSAREVYQVLQEKIEGGRELLTTGESLVFKVAAAKVRSLVRKEILEKDGGGQKFLYSHGLCGLVSHPRDFLDKISSLGSVLRCFFPGVVDENNEDAIQPHEIDYKC